MMGSAKLEIKISEITFSGEGEQEWLATQLDKVMEQAADLLKLAVTRPVQINSSSLNDHPPADLSNHNEIATQPLAVWLKTKNADTVQNDKFLATAIWLEAKGQPRIQTKDVSRALSQASQRKLNNPSECLNQNAKKGFVEKEGNQFYVTEEGKRSLGIS